MSASLVGSEMCIRDSIRQETLMLLSTHELLISGSGADKFEGIEGAYTETVSYTHLTLPTICSV
eukprot:12559459-Alexandrium_andersonii.AAC.1